ncbi:hypothetical protein GCM10022247_05950 [Allokutzneria multivorans]|uniref:Uncharacterized protein n=1 Tax=Allokutzneria multivorans TaxID=1142134 RepID=A0ABP7QYX1_9PSEU
MTDRWVLVPPEDFEDEDWELARSRGLFLNGHLGHGDRRFPVIIYEPVRIVLDAERGSRDGPLYEPNVILVPDLTQDAVEQEIAWLERNGHLEWLLELSAEHETEWSLVVPDTFDWDSVHRRGVASASLRHGERTFSVMLCDPDGVASVVGWRAARDTRLAGTSARVVRLYEENMIVLGELTRESVEHAVAELGRSGQFRWLLG